MRVETPVVLSAKRREVVVSGAPPGDSGWSFEARDAGGGCTTGASCGVSWRLHAKEGSVLDLVHFSLSSGAAGGGEGPGEGQDATTALRLVFPSPLLPAVASAPLPGGGVSLFVLSSAGHLWQVALPSSSSSSSSPLASVTASSSHVAPIDISAELEPLGQPTCMVAGSGVLAVGTTAGTSVAFPLAAAAPSAATPHLSLDRATELRSASWSIGRLLPSIFGSMAVAGMVDATILPPPPAADGHKGSSSGPLLLALHSDGALVGWCLRRRTRVLLSPLVPEGFPPLHPDLRPSRLAAAWSPSSSSSSSSSSQGPSVRFAAALSDGRGAGGVWTGRLHAAAAGGELRLEGSAVAMEGFEGQVVDLQIEAGGSVVTALVHRQAAMAFVEADLSQSNGGAAEGSLLEEGLREWLPDADSIVDGELLKNLTQELGGPEEAVTAQGGLLGLEEHFLDRLLDPHTVSLPALQEALGYLGFLGAAEEVPRKSCRELRSLVSSCIAGIHRSGLGAWHDLLAAYWAAWQVQEAPVGLLLHAGSGFAGVVRGAAGVGVLRSASPLELLLSGRARLASVAAELPDPQMAQELMALSSCASAVRGCFGALLSGLFLSATRSGRSPEQELLPAFSSILTAGPRGSSRPSDYERQAFSEWRQKRRKTVLLISRRLGSLASPAAAVSAALGALKLPPKGAASLSGSQQQQQHLSGRLLAAVAAQLAGQQAAACRDLLLLLTVADNTAAQPPQLGGASPSEVMSTAQAELLSSCLALTLASFPVELPSAAAGASSDPGAALKQLSLDPSGLHRRPLGSDASASGAAASAALEATAAELLVAATSSSSSLPGIPSSGGGPRGAGAALTGAGLRFAAQLASGGGGGSGSGPAAMVEGEAMEVEEGLCPVDAVVAAAMTMLSQRPRQLLLVRRLVGLAGAGSSSSANDSPSAELFLTGLCAQLEFSAHGTKPPPEVLMERAVRPLLRAAQGVNSHPAMAAQLRELKAELTGTPVEEIDNVSTEDYYKTIMLFFEQQGCPEGAVHFARAAVRACEGREAEVGPKRLGLLWAALFNYTAEAHDWQEAYAALLSNPDPEHTRGCLHQMLRLLMNAKRVDLICGLPWAGTRPLAPGGPPVPLIQEVVTYLRRWADESDLYDAPQPYAVLFDLCVTRNDFRGAAEAQLCLARRLVVDRRESGLSGLRSVEAALNSAHDALSLMDSPQAWLEEPLAGHGSLADYSKQPPLWSGRAPAAPAPASGPPRAATPASLRRESALVSARAAVAEAMPTSPSADLATPLSWHDVFTSLLAGGMPSEATVLSLAWAQHKELEAALEEAVRAMAEKAARLQLQVAGGGATDELRLAAVGGDDAMRGTAADGSDGGDGPTAAGAWAQLRRHLESLGASSARGSHLAVAAADSILTIRPSIRLPQWLADMFGEGPEASATVGESWRNPAALLRLYLKYDKLPEARDLVHRMLDRWKEVPFTKRQKGGAWFPYNLIDTLHARLGEGSPDGQALASLVRDTLETARQDAGITMAQATAG